MSAAAPSFYDRVYAVVCLVPAGRLTTYGDVAAALGVPRNARQVGWALAALLPQDVHRVPWWRVINAASRISFKGDTVRGERQIARLAADGLNENDSGRYPLKTVRWRFTVDEVAEALHAVGADALADR